MITIGVLVAVSARFGSCCASLCWKCRRGDGWDIFKSFADWLGTLLGFAGAFAVHFSNQDKLRDRLTYARSILIVEVHYFNRLGIGIFDRLGKTYDPISVRVTSVYVSDTSSHFIPKEK